MAICLVAGGAGFIGSHLVEALAARGHTVRVLDNFSSGVLDNLAKVRHDVEIIFGDLDDEALLRQALEGVDLVFQMTKPADGGDELPNAAAKWSFPSENLRVLTAARQANVRRLIFASSCSVYEPSHAGRLAENSWLLPDTAAGFAKLSGELQCIGFTALYGLETVRLRYAHVFGPRQCPTSADAQAVPVIVKSMLAGQAPMLQDDGSASQDLIHVDD